MKPQQRRYGRRAFFADVGMGFTGLALGAMLARDGVVRADSGLWTPPDGTPHFQPKAKNVIWIFLIGGLSQMESFDPKPELTKYANQEIDATPYQHVLKSPLVEDNLRVVIPDDANGQMRLKLYPLQVGFKKHGESGLEISDWFPHVATCADDLAVVRSVWTTDNNHGAQLQFHTGRHVLEGGFPTVGSWVHYGLGSLNDNLPQFVVMGEPLADCCGGLGGHAASYLGPEHDGVWLSSDPAKALPFTSPGVDRYHEEQLAEFEMVNQLNRLSAVQYPSDAAMQARIKSYELAFRMQRAVPDVVNTALETKQTQEMYGLHQKPTETFGRQCLVARRLVEEGVRFVQIYHGNNGGAGKWDAHSNLKAGHTQLCGEVDQPIAALLKDLKQRGLLDETLVVIGTEFGRTPGAQGSDGRDHHPYGFSVVMAGGGLKGGIAHGRTDEIGFHAIEDRHYVTDIHATILHQLGLDSRKLEIPGRKRLDIDHGEPIQAIIA